MTVRLAIGATRMRILRQSLIESGLVALAGGGAGLLAAAWALQLSAISPIDFVTGLGDISIDWRAAAFAVAASVACTIVFGLAPALRGARVSLAAAGRGRVTSDTPAGRRTCDLLVVLQSAVAVLLVVGALLIVGSVGALMRVDAGFVSHWRDRARLPGCHSRTIPPRARTSGTSSGCRSITACSHVSARCPGSSPRASAPCCRSSIDAG